MCDGKPCIPSSVISKVFLFNTFMEKIIIKKCRKLKHGMTKTKFYAVWCNIKTRCFNKNNKEYKNYGNREIIICKEWLEFINFRDDMYDNYLKHKKNNLYTSIDRIDNNLGYNKENCKWASVKEQQNNKRSNRSIIYKGKIQNIKQLGKELNIKYTTLLYRLNNNWSIEKMLKN